jgi:hypothetical protein
MARSCPVHASGSTCAAPRTCIFLRPAPHGFRAMPFISRRRSSYQQGDKPSCAVPTPPLASAAGAFVAAGIGLLAADVITMLFDTTPG